MGKEASSSSQSQASIFESGYSCLLPARVSWVGSWFSLVRSCIMLCGWPVLGAVSSMGLVSVAAGGSGIHLVWFVQAQHSHLNIFCHASFFLCQYRVKISVSCSMSCLARRIPTSSMSVSSQCSIDATSRSAFQWISQQV